MSYGFSYSSKVFAAVCILSLLFTACSPEAMPRNFPPANRDFGPTRTDGDVAVDEVKMESLPSAESIRWKGDIDTASWYRASDDLAWLGRQLSAPGLGHLSYRMRESVVDSATWETTVGGSAYASAAIGETRADTTKSVQEGVAMLKSQQVLVAKLLANRNANTNWSKKRVSLVTVVDEIGEFLVAFVKDVEKSAVDKAVKKQLVEELRVNFGPKIQRIKDQVVLAYREDKVYNFVAKVRTVLTTEGLDLGPNIGKRLDLAERLPREVERIKDSKSALSVLVDFWQASSLETRETKFKTMAPELYDFFDSQSPTDLDCIKTGCGFFTRIKRALFILPKIEEYGIDKIRKQLSDAAEEAVKSELELQSVQFLPGLYKEIESQINTEISRQSGNIAKISKDYGTYLRLVLNRMALAKFGLKEKDTVAGVEPQRIRVDLDFGRTGKAASADKIQTARVPGQSRGGFQTGAAAIGAGLAAAIEIHDSHIERELRDRDVEPLRIRQAQGRLFFEQLNKVLMIGGFKAESSKSFDSFSLAVNAPGARRREPVSPRFNLRTMISSKATYAVPEALSLGKPPRADAVVVSMIPKTVSISIAGQAELLRGLSRTAMSLRDWKPSPFDRVLGVINIADFVTDLPREAIQQSLFPKDLFFAAAIGNAGAILKNVTKDLSPVALISPNRQMHWADQKDPAEDPTQQAIMAAAFDITDGVRSLETKTVDVARYLSSIVDFLRATEGIENTKSDVLSEADAKGVRPIDQLLEARTDLKMLVMAMANFISNEALNEKGLIRPVFTRTAQNAAVGMSGEPQLLDQAIAIRALLDASEAISATIFRTAAIDLMSATNSAFFRTDLGFYSEHADKDEAPNLEAVAAVLVAGERLSPYLAEAGPAGPAQWIRISRPWINALRDASEKLP